MVKNLPGMCESWVLFLSYEDPLEEGMATHSSILVWRIPWTEETGGLEFMRSQRVTYTEKLTLSHTFTLRMDLEIFVYLKTLCIFILHFLWYNEIQRTSPSHYYSYYFSQESQPE